jgi:hypothetical protein
MFGLYMETNRGLKIKQNNREFREINITLPYRVLWGAIWLLCIINLYVFFLQFLEIVTPTFFHVSKDNDFVSLFIFPVITFL